MFQSSFFSLLFRSMFQSSFNLHISNIFLALIFNLLQFGSMFSIFLLRAPHFFILLVGFTFLFSFRLHISIFFFQSSRFKHILLVSTFESSIRLRISIFFLAPFFTLLSIFTFQSSFKCFNFHILGSTFQSSFRLHFSSSFSLHASRKIFGLCNLVFSTFGRSPYLSWSDKSFLHNWIGLFKRHVILLVIPGSSLTVSVLVRQLRFTTTIALRQTFSKATRFL